MKLATASPVRQPIPERPLGRCGLAISLIGLGGAPLGDLYAELDETTARNTVAAAYRAGISHFDTSPLYGHGLSEQRFGSVLRRLPRGDFVLSTKVGRWMNPHGPRGDGSGYVGGLPHRAVIDYSYDGTMRAFEQSLLRLGLDRIDILLIHDVDVWTHGADAVEARFREAMDGSYRALARLKGEGVIAAIGIGVNEAEMAERFAREGDFDTMMLAGRYSLIEQPALARFLPLAEAKGIGVMLGGVFNSGILATGAVAGARYNYQPAPPDIMKRVRRIEAVCRAHAVPLPHAALQFALAAPAVASVVLGAASPEEVERNVLALAKPVPSALWTDLRSEGLLAPHLPVPL
jgi:D-threo-aldose 1-dehydrogenase